MKLYPRVTDLFIIWLLAIYMIGFFGFVNLPHSTQFGFDFLESLGNWDGSHFLEIAESGYKIYYQYAFFPLYPLLIKLVSYFTKDLLIAALLISISTSLAALIILEKLVRLYFDKETASHTIIYLLVFPTAFFFTTVYSEGLFLLLSVLAFYAFKKKNNVLCLFATILASLTRLAAIAIIAALFYEIVKKGIDRKNWILLLSPVGFILYCLYLLWQTGDALAFISAESNWQRSLTIPFFSLIESIKKLSSPAFFIFNMSTFFDLAAIVFGIGMILRSFRFLPRIFSIYGLISILIPIMTSNLMSAPRFLLPVFPIFILIAKIKNKNVLFAYILFSIMLLAIFTILFLNGYWVA